MKILMVHGRAQGGKLADDLKSTWIQTLQEGFREARETWPAVIDVAFPYYAETLDRLSAQADLPTSLDILTKGPGKNREFEQFMQSALDEIRSNAAIPDDDVTAQMDPGASQEKGPQNWAWVQALARVIDNHLTRASTLTIERFLRDVFLYVTNRNIARQVDAIVEADLTAEPTLVIGHSLGTVVAYNVIMKNRKRLGLRKFITVGSPLGLHAISSKLGIPDNPAGKSGWYNAYDERDIVALNPLDDTYFPTDPSIINNNRVNNTTANRHGIIGYLNDGAVAGQIAAALR